MYKYIEKLMYKPKVSLQKKKKKKKKKKKQQQTNNINKNTCLSYNDSLEAGDEPKKRNFLLGLIETFHYHTYLDLCFAIDRNSRTFSFIKVIFLPIWSKL